MTNFERIAAMRGEMLRVLAMLVIGLSTVAVTRAATVKFTLDTSGSSGTFNLYADCTGADNFGLASYNILLKGPLTSVDHKSPSLTFGSKGAFNGAAGFNLFRTADSAAPATPFQIGASQDTVNASAPNNLVYGYGMTASSFTSVGFTPLLPGVDPQTWDSHLLIASGTFATGADLPSFDSSSVEVFANVFDTPGGASVKTAQLSFLETSLNEIPPIIIPRIVNVLAFPPIISNLQLTAVDNTTPTANLVWSNLQNPPDGPGKILAGPADATLSPTGLFSWDLTGWKGGVHTFTASVTDASNGTTSGRVLTVITAPEPGSITLGVPALAGSVVFVRRRSRK